MKSLAERLKEKEARLAKEKLKRSGPVKCFTVRIPYDGYPASNVEGDIIYLKKRAKAVINKIRSSASWQFYEEMKEIIGEITKQEKKEVSELEARWTTFTVRTTDATPSPDNSGGVVPTPIEPATPPDGHISPPSPIPQ